MTTANKLFELAQLAEASYAKFYDGNGNLLTSPADIKAALIANNFSDAQAEEFTNNWEIATQQPDITSSFSGTLFKYIGDNDDSGLGFQNGQYVYALKGTLETGDGGADVGDIAIDGLALDQIVDMYNDWQRINAGVGNTYQAAELVTLTDETNIRATYAASSPLVIVYDALMASQGYIIDKPLGLVRKIEFKPSDQLFNDERAHGNINLDGALVDVTGHSLGGHLADAFSRLFGSQNNAEVLTINGAGYPTGLLPARVGRNSVAYYAA